MHESSSFSCVYEQVCMNLLVVCCTLYSILLKSVLKSCCNAKTSPRQFPKSVHKLAVLNRCPVSTDASVGFQAWQVN